MNLATKTKTEIAQNKQHTLEEMSLGVTASGKKRKPFVSKKKEQPDGYLKLDRDPNEPTPGIGSSSYHGAN